MRPSSATFPRLRRISALVVAALTLVLVGCAGATDDGAAATTSPAPSRSAPDSLASDPTGAPVVVITHEGGCMMIGPNCLEWSVFEDGTWTATRVDELDEVAAGQVPAPLVTDVMTAAEAALADDVVAVVGPGVCNACADGIDLRVTVTTPSGELGLDSVEQDFRADVAVFDAIAALEAELVATTDVAPVSR